MPIPSYPDFADISLDMRDELLPSLNGIPDGISEFTFSNLYLFRGTYGYRLSRVDEEVLLVEGSKQGKTFFYAPFKLPPDEILKELMERKDYLKNLSERQVVEEGERLQSLGYEILEDRDNFDYVYERRDLAELVGKTYHKKRNLVNAFTNSYTCVSRILDHDNLGDALEVLKEWAELKGEHGDFEASKEALELHDYLGMKGCVYYVDGAPVGWCLGEPVAAGSMFAIHFEKGIDRYKGVYQFINQSFAQELPEEFRLLNREQDLGDEGLRQAKLTYRPSGFVKKHRVLLPGRAAALGFVEVAAAMEPAVAASGLSA